MLDLLPDSRARVARNIIMAPDDDGVMREWVPTFCANCGKQFGHVTATARSIVVLCNHCEETHGAPACLAKVPSSVWTDRVFEATQGMDHATILAHLDNPNSLLTKLAGDIARASPGR
jgi:hypothetical protein